MTIKYLFHPYALNHKIEAVFRTSFVMKQNLNEMKQKIIYIMDPHCGWCYANRQSVEDLYDLLPAEFEFDILPGGMWINKHSVRGGKAIKDFLLPSIIRLNEFSNADISSKYIDLIQDSTYLLKSDLVSEAINAVNVLWPKKGLYFAHALMKQQFANGNRYDVEKTYKLAIEEIELDWITFKELWKSNINKEETAKGFQNAHFLTTSFPSLHAQDENEVKKIKDGLFNVAEIVNNLIDHELKPA
jgi:putative protein-disulfide isomerase